MTHPPKKPAKDTAPSQPARSTLEELSARTPAENYQRFFVPVIGGPVAADLIESARVRPGERVLDVACGTGAVTRLAAECVGPTGTVTGVDVHPGMLAVARSVTSVAEPSIDWHESAAEALPFSDTTFEVVLCGLSLQFFQDRLAALREMRRVLTPEGRAALVVPGAITPMFDVLAEALARHVGPEQEGFVRQVFALPDAEEVHGLMSRAGFRTIRANTQSKTLRLPPPREFLWQYLYSTPAAEAMKGIDDERRAALERDVVAKWETYTEGEVLVYRQKIVSATAEK